MTTPALAAAVASPTSTVVSLRDVSYFYGHTRALDGVSLDVPAGRMVGLIGPDGVGKSTMFDLISGARAIQIGTVEALGGDMRDARHRRLTCPRIAYMPQGLGKNLDPTLSVVENVDFFGRLFGLSRQERKRRIDALLHGTGLERFGDRPAGKLSGGMKQKLGLCCSLIHDPDLLILDEPTTGVDPLSRRQFWELIDQIRVDRPGMSVMVATAYMDEASRFDWLVAMDAGRVLATGSPKELLSRTGTDSLDAAFIALLPEEKRQGHVDVVIPPRTAAATHEIAIEARGLTQRFGDFVAVDHVSFRITRGEIFGFLGSNGCGKSTTMKMLTGLLPPTEGTATLFGAKMDANDIELRRRVGYMSQAFSLYSELTVRQNLDLHARLYRLPPEKIESRVHEVADRFDLSEVMEALPEGLPLGIRQRLSLAVAMIHSPEMLILDEPTSGVDPVERDKFWQILVDLSRKDNVTIFVSTHFMNEAMRCDRISLMNAGKVLVTDTPQNIIAMRHAANLEEAFIEFLEDATGQKLGQPPAQSAGAKAVEERQTFATGGWFSPRRMGAYMMREALELRRDYLRLAMALFGSVDPVVDHGLWNQPRRRQPVLRRARPRPDDGQRELHSQYRRLALFRAASADHQQRRARPADGDGRLVELGERERREEFETIARPVVARWRWRFGRLPRQARDRLACASKGFPRGRGEVRRPSRDDPCDRNPPSRRQQSKSPAQGRPAALLLGHART